MIVQLGSQAQIPVAVPRVCHTNPIWVTVGDKPVRASKRSAQWCLTSVDKCWSQKERFIAPKEMEQAKAAYQHAREVYQRRLQECVAD